MQNRIGRVVFTKEFELDPENYVDCDMPDGTSKDITNPKEMLEYEKWLYEKKHIDVLDILDYGDKDVNVDWELLDPNDPKASKATDAETPFSGTTSAANDAGLSDPFASGAGETTAQGTTDPKGAGAKVVNGTAAARREEPCA